MIKDLFTSPVLNLLDTNPQKIFTVEKDCIPMFLTLFLNAGQDLKGEVRISVGYGPNCDELLRDYDISDLRYACDAVVLPIGRRTRRLAGGDEIYLKVTKPPEAGILEGTVFVHGFEI